MKQFSKETIIEKYLASAIVIDSVSMTLNYRKNNREVDRIARLSQILDTNLELAKDVYQILLESDCITARISAASACLKNGIFINEAENVLIELSARDDIGIRSLNASMILKAWRGEIS